MVFIMDKDNRNKLCYENFNNFWKERNEISKINTN